MSLTKRVGILTGAAALTLTGVSFADAQAADKETQSRIAELEAQVAQLRAGQGDNWLTESRAKEIRSLVQDVLADADSRASLQGSGMTAGYDKGFFLGSSDGNFKLKIGGHIQTRWVWNRQDGAAGDFNWQDMHSLALSDFGDVSTFNPDAQTLGLGGGLADLIADGAGSRAALYADVPLMDALAFSAAEQADLVAAHVAASPGQQLDLDATTWQFINQRLGTLTDAQRDAFAQALGSTAPGFTNVNGMPISFTNFSEYSAFLQSLYDRQLDTASNADDERSGFDNPLVRLTFSGHVVNPHWKYHIMGEFARNGGGAFLQDAWIEHDCGNGWSFRAGQFKPPVLREELVDEKFQQAPSRSLLNSMFTTGRSQGIGVAYAGDPIRWAAMLHDGANLPNTPWEFEDNETIAVASRLEWLAMGNWDQFDGIPSFQGDPMGVLVGIAVNYQKSEYGTGAMAPGSSIRQIFPNNIENEQFTLTADASADFGGANLFGAFVYRSQEPSGSFEQQVLAGSNTFDQDQWGFLLQGGFFIAQDWELFGRFEWADADMPDIRVGGVSVYEFDDLMLATVGVNKYFGNPGARHQVKWTLDAGYAFDRVEFFAADPSAGWRNDTGGDDGQFVVRTQLGLYF